MNNMISIVDARCALFYRCSSQGRRLSLREETPVRRRLVDHWLRPEW